MANQLANEQSWDEDAGKDDDDDGKGGGEFDFSFDNSQCGSQGSGTEVDMPHSQSQWSQSQNTQESAQNTHAMSLFGADGVCEKLFLDSGKSEPLLFCMAHGLMSPDRKTMIADWIETPHQALLKNLKPKLPMLHKEVQRRHDKFFVDLMLISQQFTAKKLRPDGHTMPQCLSWLKKNPIECGVDVVFLSKEEAAFFNLVSSAAQAKEKESESTVKKACGWTSNEPHLRPCCCAFDDVAQNAFTVKDDALNRAQLDARNHVD